MKYLLSAFFFLMYAGDNLGLNVGFGLGLSVKNLMLYVLFAGVLVNAAIVRNRTLEYPSVLVPFALLLVYAVATWLTVAFVLQDPEYEMRRAFIALKGTLADQYITLLVFLFGTISMRDAFWVLRAMIWIALAGNVVTLIDAFNVPNLDIVEARMQDERFLGFIGNANGYGQFLVLFLPPSIALYAAHRGKVRMLIGIGIIASGLALVLTGSRGAYAGLVAGSVAAAFYLRRFVPFERVLQGGLTAAVLGAVVVLAAALLGYADVYLDQVLRFEGSAHVATSGRSTIWANAIAAMLENPVSFLTGYGFHAYESHRFYAAPHNMYLSYLYDLGVIGLGLFVLVFWRILTSVRTALPNAPAELRPHFIGFVFGLTGFLVSIFFSEYTNSAYLLWGYLGIGLRMAAEANRGEVEVAVAERLPEEGGLVVRRPEIG